VGLPFLVVSATAPLLQRWFTHTGPPRGAQSLLSLRGSNLGSMLALLAIPPWWSRTCDLQRIDLVTQTALWSLATRRWPFSSRSGALTLWWNPRPAPAPAIAEAESSPAPPRGAAVPRRIHWVVLAFVRRACSRVTTYITTTWPRCLLLWCCARIPAEPSSSPRPPGRAAPSVVVALALPLSSS